MFKTLHIKLTAFNLIILTIFFIIFSSFIYIGNHHFMQTSSEMGIKGLSKQIESLHEIPEFRDFPPIKGDRRFRSDRNNFFIILRNASLNITASNSYETELLDDSYKEIDKLFDTKEDERFSQITFDGQPYRIYTSYFLAENGQWGIMQICQNIEHEKRFLGGLLRSLLIMGFLSIAILAAISWFLAKKSLSPIKTSWEQQKRFIADASHELRTPLTVMQANLEIPLEEMSTTSDYYQWIQNAYEETNNMRCIVNALFELTQIDSGQKVLEKKDIDFSELVNKSIESMRPLFKEKCVELSKEIDKKVSILGDEQRLKQLIVILLDNAYKYTEQGKVAIHLKKEASQVLLTISDTGIGMSENDEEYIFDRFYRADKARSRMQGSLGLGLSIAKWIIDEHNGKVEVNSALSKGTTFKISFPL